MHRTPSQRNKGYFQTSMHSVYVGNYKTTSELAHDHRTNSKSMETVTTYKFCLIQV